MRRNRRLHPTACTPLGGGPEGAPEGELLKTFGTNLRAAREARGMLQSEVALIAGINRQAKVSDIENGKGNITLRSMVRLAKAVDQRIEIVFHLPVDDKGQD
ncbi:MAG: helix-turn-helix transcriptional regulator [Janthinobacterium lividum]